MLWLALVVAAVPPSWSQDCGLEPPGAVIAPVPTKPNELPWYPQDPPLVRAERRSNARTASSPTATLKQQGALAGKVIYLSAGHGFTWEAGSINGWRTQRSTTNEIVEDLVSTETIHQYLVPMLLNAGAQVVTVREADLNPNLVIVDDGTPGYVEAGGAALFADSSLAGWGAPTLPMPTGINPFALAKNRLMDAAATATASATYTATFPADGYYNVYVSYSQFTARVTDAHYIVKHAGGDAHFRVNQRRHGSTWNLLGRFYFLKGTRASLVVQNDSKDTGNVSLDAVRFGGGMGLIDRGGGVSGRPRFEESARYHAQYAGAPATVYDNADTDHDDDVSTRSRFAAWMHEPGEDAVYLAWHTNAANASAVGTDIYVYGPNPVDGTYQFTGTVGSDKLAQFVHTELINDFRASTGWNRPTWQDRGIHSAYFGELNPAHNSEMPSILMEIAFHDAAADATHLKEPAFRYLATRAIAQGIIRFFADKDGTAPKFPPEPPTHLAALNQGAGLVKVQWRAPAADTQGVWGAVPTGYRVFQSADGLAWDDGVDVAGTSATLPLTGGSARYFRVASLNAGGASFPSEVVGARSGSPRVMVINAFDRLEASMVGKRDNLATYALGNVLRILLWKMNDASYVQRWGDAIDAAQLGFDSATSLAVTSGDAPLSQYAVVGFMAGKGHPAAAGPLAAEITALSAGKPLVFTGGAALRTLAMGGAAETGFLSSVLRVGTTAAVNTQATVNPTGFLAGVPALTLDDGNGGSYEVGTTDITNVTGGATLIATYPSGLGAALAADKSQVTFGFPFEAITSRAERLAVMARVLTYFDVAADGGAVIPDAGPTIPDAGQPPAPDAGVDAGVVDPPDAGPPPDITLGVLPNAYEGAVIKQCGCSAGLAPPVFLLVVLALRVVSGRRKS